MPILASLTAENRPIPDHRCKNDINVEFAGSGSANYRYFFLDKYSKHHYYINMKTFTVKLDDNLHQDLKIICASLGASMNGQIQGLIMQFVAKHGDKLPVPTKK